MRHFYIRKAGILLAMCFGFWQCRKFGIIADKLMIEYS